MNTETRGMNNDFETKVLRTAKSSILTKGWSYTMGGESGEQG